VTAEAEPGNESAGDLAAETSGRNNVIPRLRCPETADFEIRPLVRALRTEATDAADQVWRVEPMSALRLNSEAVETGKLGPTKRRWRPTKRCVGFGSPDPIPWLVAASPGRLISSCCDSRDKHTLR